LISSIKSYPGQRRKVRSMEEQQREVKKVGIGEINEDIDLESRLPMLPLRLLEPCLKTRFNEKL